MKLNVSRLRTVLPALALVLLTVASCLFDTGLGTLSAAGIGFITGICPLGSIEAALGARGITPFGTLCLVLSLVIIVITGKAFCAWVCPKPLFQRLVTGKKGIQHAEGSEQEGEIGTALSMPDASESVASKEYSCSSCGSAACSSLKPVGGKRDGVKLDTRHLVLGGACASSLLFGFPVFCLVCPIGLSFATVFGLWHLFQFNETSWGLLIYPALLTIELVLFKKWCTKICPLSALLSLVANANRLFRPQVDETRCLRSKGMDCRACVEICPEEVDPHTPRIQECTKCHLCSEHCPTGAITFPPFRNKQPYKQP
ncbi:MAG: 4Fe-4S binding protein [Coriobacteriales bacterium]|nr:4Fe-4S binding protein [Coriobacteriales bacterium]